MSQRSISAATMNPNRLGPQETLLNEWLESYPTAQRPEFHKDGIVDDLTFQREATRLLYVLLEGNSKGGKYDQFRGCDLRWFFREVLLRKNVHINLANWTRALLDGVKEYDNNLTAAEANVQLRRVAVMNLKKLGGSGKANVGAIRAQAWRDRKFIRQEVEIVAPAIIVTCGKLANQLFGRIIGDCPSMKIPEKAVWTHETMKILPANHPSLRPTNAPSAFRRLLERASNGAVGAFAR